jgi:predicted transcriptional regulator
MAQGKAWNKKKVIEALEPYLKLGYSVNKSCEIVGIAQSTVQTWIDKENELRLKIASWQVEPDHEARKVIVQSIKEGKVDDAKWWAERREKQDFSTRTETDVTTKGEKLQSNLPPDVEEVLKQAQDKLKEKLAE